MRREFITLLGGAAAAWPVAARAQQPAMLRVRALSPLPRARAFIQGFEARMRELGYVEGQNYTLDWTDLQGQSERYPAAMQGLVDRKVDVIIASGPEDALKAATAATKTIPIVRRQCRTGASFSPQPRRCWRAIRNESCSSRCSTGCRRCSCSGRMSTRAGSCLTGRSGP